MRPAPVVPQVLAYNPVEEIHEQIYCAELARLVPVVMREDEAQG